MISATQITHRFDFLLGLIDIHSLQHNIQEWIRKEIVDDDPYEQETLSGISNKLDTRILEKMGNSDFRLSQ